MTYSIGAWVQHSTDEFDDERAAAVRALRTGERHVVDAAYGLQSAIARGKRSEIEAAQARLREAYESDIRRKGGRPEDYYGSPGFFFGNSENFKKINGLIIISLTALTLLILKRFV